MICQRCTAQSPDHSNFCFHCGLQFNPNVPPNMPPMGNPLGMMPVTDDKKEKYIFNIGMIIFIVNMFWSLWRIMGTLARSEMMYDMNYFMNYLQVLTYSLGLMFAFIYSKKQNYKTTLIVFFVVSVVITLLSKMMNYYY